MHSKGFIRVSPPYHGSLISHGIRKNVNSAGNKQLKRGTLIPDNPLFSFIQNLSICSHNTIIESLFIHLLRQQYSNTPFFSLWSPSDSATTAPPFPVPLCPSTALSPEIAHPKPMPFNLNLRQTPLPPPPTMQNAHSSSLVIRTRMGSPKITKHHHHEEF